MTEKDLDEWRANPVTEYVIRALREQTVRRESAMKDAYWAGSPAPEAERLAAQMVADLVEDIAAATLPDFQAFMESSEDEE